jgi:hypothetical protein
MSREALKVDPHETLWVTDAELIRRSGIPEKRARAILQDYDRDPRRSQFPQKQKLYGDRRYWPAVKAYFDRLGGLTMDAPTPPLERRRYAR